MGNVVSINNGKFLGAYCDAQNSERIPDEVFFFAGVTLSLVLPQIIYSAYGGLIPFIAFAGSALAGSILGMVMHYQSTYQIISCVSTGTVPQAPPSKDAALKEAA